MMAARCPSLRHLSNGSAGVADAFDTLQGALAVGAVLNLNGGMYL